MNFRVARFRFLSLSFPTLFSIVAVVSLLSGCSSAGYLMQSISGHLHMLGDARPVQSVIDDSQTPPRLRERLELSQRMRSFAATDLHLPDNASYRRYADLKRPAVVWNVVAAPELSLTLETWCFPIVGCVGYRGYFDRTQADAMADELRARGLEATVYGVPAYSTLGRIPGDWFSDPLLNTFIYYPEGELARMVFHELAHQVAFAKDDTMFNESFATTVERVGGHRWLESHSSPAAQLEYEVFNTRRLQFQSLTLRYRKELDTLYKSGATDDEKRAGKAALMQRLRADYATMRDTEWGGFKGYDGWFERANNASLGVMAAYTELVPGFERLLARQDGDLGKFYVEVKQLADMPKDQRRAALAP
ncbi:aminopeptidase [soil metagenome]